MFAYRVFRFGLMRSVAVAESGATLAVLKGFGPCRMAGADGPVAEKFQE
jgi:hypothetical protein